MTYKRLTPEVRNGSAMFGDIAQNSYADIAVTFDVSMSKVPNVCALRTSAGTTGYDMQLATLDVTKNGFTLRCWNRGTYAISPRVSWMAVAS